MNVEQKVINYYPFPIALTFKNFINLSNSDDSIDIKHRVLGNLVEIIIKYMAFIAVSQYKSDDFRDKEIDELFSNITSGSSSVDQWNNLLKSILKFYRENNKKFFISELNNFYFDKKKDEFTYITIAYKELNSILNEGDRDLKQISFNDFAPRLLKYHFTFWENKYTNLTKKQLKKHVLLFEPAIEELLENLAFLCDYKLVYLVSEDPLRTDKQYNIQTYMGYNPQTTCQSVPVFKELEIKQLYLCDFKKPVPALKLHPFLLLEYCAECSCGQIFLFKEKGDSLVYLSSQCGHEYFPDRYLGDLKKQFAVEDVSEGKKGPEKDKSSLQEQNIYEIALEIAMSDGPLSKKESEKLEEYRNKFNIQKSTAQELFKNIEAKMPPSSRKSGNFIETIRNATSKTSITSIYNNYPYPIAHNYWLINQSSEDFVMILKNICGFFSGIIKYFSFVFVSQYIRDKIDDVNLNINLEKIVEPSLEEWLLYLEETLKLYHGKDEKLIISDFYEYYFSKQSSWENAVKFYNEINNDDFFCFKSEGDMEIISPSEFFRIVPDFVDTIEYCGDDLSLNKIKKLLVLLVPAVDEIMLSLRFLTSYKLFYVKKAAYEKGRARHEIIDCMGAINFNETEYFSENYFTQDKVYLNSIEDKDFPILNLSPFLIMSDSLEEIKGHLLFYQRVAGDGSLEYANANGDMKFSSQEPARDLTKAFKKFTAEKKINLVIKLLDWQKEKRKRDTERRDKLSSGRKSASGDEQRKGQEDIKKLSDTKKQARNTYRYALEVAWSDGVLSEDERIYLDELKRVLSLSNEDVKIIEDSTASKFSVKIDQARHSKDRGRDELEQNLEFLEEEHQILLKSLEERRQQIRLLEKKIRESTHERDICRVSAEKAELEKLETEKQNTDLKKLLNEYKSKGAIAEKGSGELLEIRQFEKKIKELEEGKKLRDKKLEKFRDELSKAVEHINKLKTELLDSRNKVAFNQKEIKELESKLSDKSGDNTQTIKDNEILKLKEEIQSLKQEISKQEKLIITFKEKSISDEEKDLEGHIIKEQLDDLMMVKTRLEADLLSSNKKREALIKLVQELNKKFEEAKKNQIDLKEVEKLKSKIKILEEENIKLKKLEEKLENLEAQNSVYVELKNTGEEEVLKLSQDLTLAHSEISRMEEDVHAVSHEREELLKLIDELNDKLCSSDKLLSEYQEKVLFMEELEKRIGKIEMEKEELLSGNERQGQKIREKIIHINELNENIKSLHSQVDEISEEKAVAEEKLEKLLKEFAMAKNYILQAKTKLADYEKVKLEKEGLLRNNDELNNNLSEAHHHIDDIELKMSMMEKQCEELELSCRDLENQLLIAQQKAVQGEKISGERNRILQKLKDFEKERAELVKNNEKQKTKIIELVHKNKNTHDEYNSVLDALKSVEAEREELLILNREFEDRIKMYEQELMNSQERQAEYSGHDPRIDNIEKENMFLFESLESKTSRIKELEGELKKYREKLLDAEKKYSSLIKEKDRYDVKIKELQENLSAASVQNQKDVPEHDYMVEKLRLMKKQFEELKVKEQDRLKEEKRKKKLDIKRKTDDLRKQKDEWNKIKYEKEELKKAKDELDLKLSEGGQKIHNVLTSDEDVSKLKDELEKEKKDFETNKEVMQKEVEKQKEELKDQQKELITIKMKLEKMKTALEAEKRKLDQEKANYKKTLEKELDEKNKEILSMKNQLEELSAASSSLKEEDMKSIEEEMKNLEKEKKELEAKNLEIETLLSNFSKDKELFAEEKKSLELEKNKIKELQVNKDDLNEEKMALDNGWNDLAKERELLDREREAFEEEKKSFPDLEKEDIDSERKVLDDGWDELARQRSAFEEDRKSFEMEQKAGSAMEEIEMERAELDNGWNELARERDVFDLEREELLKEKELFEQQKNGQSFKDEPSSLDMEKKDLEAAWAELEEEKENLRVLKEQALNSNQQFREELEMGWLELEEQRKAFAAQASALDQGQNEELEEAWRLFQEERAKFDEELKVLERERMFLSQRKIEQSIEDLNNPDASRETLVLKRGEVETFLNKYMPKEYLDELKKQPDSKS